MIPRKPLPPKAECGCNLLGIPVKCENGIEYMQGGLFGGWKAMGFCSGGHSPKLDSADGKSK